MPSSFCSATICPFAARYYRVMQAGRKKNHLDTSERLLSSLGSSSLVVYSAVFQAFIGPYSFRRPMICHAFSP